MLVCSQTAFLAKGRYRLQYKCSHRPPVVDTSTGLEVLMASVTCRLLLSPVLWARVVKIEDKSRRYVFDAINTSEPVEVSRTSGLP